MILHSNLQLTTYRIKFCKHASSSCASYVLVKEQCYLQKLDKISRQSRQNWNASARVKVGVSLKKTYSPIGLLVNLTMYVASAKQYFIYFANAKWHFTLLCKMSLYTLLLIEAGNSITYLIVLAPVSFSGCDIFRLYSVNNVALRLKLKGYPRLLLEKTDRHL